MVKYDHNTVIIQYIYSHILPQRTPSSGCYCWDDNRYLTLPFAHQEAGSAGPRIPYLRDKKEMHLTDNSEAKLIRNP